MRPQTSILILPLAVLALAACGGKAPAPQPVGPYLICAGHYVADGRCPGPTLMPARDGG